MSLPTPYYDDGKGIVIYGRKCIGLELEEKYCEIAAKRLSQEVLSFDP